MIYICNENSKSVFNVQNNKKLLMLTFNWPPLYRTILMLIFLEKMTILSGSYKV